MLDSEDLAPFPFTVLKILGAYARKSKLPLVKVHKLIGSFESLREKREELGKYVFAMIRGIEVFSLAKTFFTRSVIRGGKSFSDRCTAKVTIIYS